MAQDFTAPDPLRADANPKTISIYITELQACVNSRREEISQVALTFVSQIPGKTFSLNAIEELKERVNTLAIDFGYENGVENSELLGRPYVDHPQVCGLPATGFPIINDLRRVLELLEISTNRIFAPIFIGRTERPTDASFRRGFKLSPYSSNNANSLKIDYIIDINEITASFNDGFCLDIPNIGDNDLEITVGGNSPGVPFAAGKFAIHTFSFDNPTGQTAHYTEANEPFGGVTSEDILADKNFIYLSSGETLNRYKIRDENGDLIISKIDESNGTPIGDLTDDGGLSSAFDGLKDQPEANSATKTIASAGTGFIGKQWSGDIPVTVTRAEINSSNIGFTFPDTTPIIFKLQASTDNFATSIIELGSETLVTDPQDSTTVIQVSENSGAYLYHRVLIEVSSGPVQILVSELTFFGEGGELVEDQALEIQSHFAPNNDTNFHMGVSGNQIFILGEIDNDPNNSTIPQPPADVGFPNARYGILVVNKGNPDTGNPGEFLPMTVESFTEIEPDPFGLIAETETAINAFTADAGDGGKRANVFEPGVGVRTAYVQAITADEEWIYLIAHTNAFASAIKQTSSFGVDVGSTPVTITNVFGTPELDPGGPSCTIPSPPPQCFTLQECNPINEIYFELDNTIPSEAEHRGQIATLSVTQGSSPQRTNVSPALVCTWEYEDAGLATFEQFLLEDGIVRFKKSDLSEFEVVYSDRLTAQNQNGIGSSVGLIRQGDYIYVFYPRIAPGTSEDDRVGVAVINKETGDIVTGDTPGGGTPGDTTDILFFDADNIPAGESEPYSLSGSSKGYTYDEHLVQAPKPTSFTSGNSVGDTSIRLNWSTQTEAFEGYKIWFVDGSGARTLAKHVTSQAAFTTLIEGLTPDTAYTFVINSIGYHADSLNSSPLTVSTPEP